MMFFLYVIILSGYLKLISGGNNCLGSDACLNGYCNDVGNCVCNSCWKGENCDEYVDYYSPVFLETWQLIKLKPTTTRKLFTISAIDEDLALTCKYDVNCQCGVVYYFIVAGNDHQMFELNVEKGIVSLSNWAQLYSGAHHRLVFGASNINNSSTGISSELTVDLEIENNETEVGVSKSRWKRDTEMENVEILFQRLPPGIGDEIKLGSGADYQLEIILLSKAVNLKLHIFTVIPNTDDTTLRLCDVSVKKRGTGINSSMEINQMTGQYVENKNGGWKSGINFDFGSISGDQSSSILIKFKVLLIKTDLAIDGSIHHVNVKSEIDGKNPISYTGRLIAKISKDDDSNDHNAYFSLNGPNSAYRGSTVIYKLDVISTFPSEDMQFVVFVDFDNLKLLSVERFELLRKGKNFICVDEDAITLLVTDTDVRFLSKLDMGILHNCGLEKNNKANTLEFEFVVKIKKLPGDDSISNVRLQFGARIGGKRVWTGIGNLTILPQKKEKSYVNVTLSSDENLIYDDGAEAQLKLTMTCNAELNFVLLRIILPEFLTYNSHSANVSDVSKTDTPYVQFEIKKPLRGISQIILMVSVNLKSKKQQISSQSTILLPVQVVCEFESQFYFCATVEPARVTFKPTELSCQETKPFTLHPCQLSSSTAINEHLSPTGNSYWSPAFRLESKNNFYQVNFGNLSLVTQLKILSGSSTTQSITKFNLLTSIDGRSWTSIGKEMSADSANISVLTRFLRILILEPNINVKDNQEIGAKFQFAGCVITQDFSLTATCHYAPQTRISTNVTEYRHFTIDETRNIFYFCDVVQEKNRLSCFCSLDLGKTWKGLPNFIGYLKGYNPRLKTVVATDTTGSALIKTENCVWWMPATAKDAESLKSSVVVPGEKADALSNLASFDKWKVDFDGVRYDGELRVNWREVCR